MNDKVRLSRFLLDRIPTGWVDRLWSQGWTAEKDPHPAAFNVDINAKSPSPPAYQKTKNA